MVGTGIPACRHCSLSWARNAVAASIVASVPRVSWAISWRLACIRVAMTPRIPVRGITWALTGVLSDVMVNRGDAVTPGAGGGSD